MKYKVGDKVKIREDLEALEKYINEYINEIVDILIKEYFSKFVNIKDVSFGDIVDCQCFDIDNDEHMWYDTFNKWNWTKFENGVIKIDKRGSN